MFAAPGILALIFIDYLRPQEYVPQLSSIPLLHIATAVALLGFVLDLRLGLSRLRPVPHLVLALLFFGWCVVTLLVRAPDQLLPRISALAIPLAVYLVVSLSVQDFRTLQLLCGLLLAICLALAALGVEQGLSDHGCHRIAYRNGHVVMLYDGRRCSEVDPRVCERENAEPGADYVCEKVGMFGTQSVHGRVRYRGTLEDPNELSLALGVSIPFAFAFLDRRRSLARILLVLVTCGLVGTCAYFTQSRGGQLVMLTVLAVYFVRRFGLRRGLVVGVILALPLLLLGGRSDAASTTERLECWWTGLHLVVASPGFGVGSGQFMEHHYLTAHNSFILATAELGLTGMVLWTSIVYMGIKIPVQALRANLPPVARTWALALLASMAGLVVGSFFLSYSYKNGLWLYVGLSGVLYQAVTRHEPDFRVRFGLRDLALVLVVDGALLGGLFGYTGLKLGW